MHQALEQRPNEYPSDEDYEPHYIKTRYQKNRSRQSLRISNKGFCVRYKEVCGELKGYQVTCSNMELIDRAEVFGLADNVVDHDDIANNVDTIDIHQEDVKHSLRNEVTFHHKLEGLAGEDMQITYSLTSKKKLCKLPKWGHKRLRIYPQRQCKNTHSQSDRSFLSIEMQSWPAPSKSSKDEGRYKLLALSQSRFSSMEQMMTSDSNVQMSMLQDTQSYGEMEAPDSVLGQEHKSTDENPLEFQKHALTNSTPSCVVNSQSEDTRQLFEFESPSDIINTSKSYSTYTSVIHGRFQA